MKKRYFSIAVMFLGVWVFGQQLSISPYSGIGVGEIKFDQNPIIGAMGGITSTATSQFGSEANFSNPAANRNLVFASFGATMGTDLVNFKTDDGLDSDRSMTYLSELSIAFPINEKVKFGIGFQPYSGIGYKVARIYEEDDPIKGIQLEGDGGLNSLHSFTSYNINEKFTVGLRANYLFGSITKNQKVAVDDSDLIADYNNDMRMRGFMVTPGFLFTKEIKENQFFSAGGTYTFHTSLNTDVEQLNSTYYYNISNEKVNIDTISYYSGDAGGHLGSSFSLGLALTKTLKYHVAVEGQMYAHPDYRFEDEFYELTSGYKLAVGSWIIPDINSYKSYFEKVVYRFGAYYEKGTVVINDHDIDQFGITFGFGLPVGRNGLKDPSMLNIAFDLGSRGTTSNGLIRENFANIKVGLNFNDVWFRARKYN